MAPSGKFHESDPSEVVEFLDQKVLKSGIGRFFRKFDGADLRPVVEGAPRSMRKATEAGVPQASINKGGMSGATHVHLWAPGEMSEHDVVRRVAAAGVTAPEPRKSFGQYVYDFGGEATGSELVQFVIAGLRALGAQPINDQWEWSASEPSGD